MIIIFWSFLNNLTFMFIINSDLSVYDRFTDPIKILYQVSLQVPRSWAIRFSVSYPTFMLYNYNNGIVHTDVHIPLNHICFCFPQRAATISINIVDDRIYEDDEVSIANLISLITIWWYNNNGGFLYSAHVRHVVNIYWYILELECMPINLPDRIFDSF